MLRGKRVWSTLRTTNEKKRSLKGEGVGKEPIGGKRERGGKKSLNCFIVRITKKKKTSRKGQLKTLKSPQILGSGGGKNKRHN